METTEAKRPRAALFVLAHAWYATKPRTPEEATACRVQLARTRDFITHGPATDIAAAGATVTAAEFDELRPAALDELRARCRACGLCARFGEDPP